MSSSTPIRTSRSPTGRGTRRRTRHVEPHRFLLTECRRATVSRTVPFKGYSGASGWYRNRRHARRHGHDGLRAPARPDLGDGGSFGLDHVAVAIFHGLDTNAFSCSPATPKPSCGGIAALVGLMHLPAGPGAVSHILYALLGLYSTAPTLEARWGPSGRFFFLVRA
jgi:hypothetical protein